MFAKRVEDRVEGKRFVQGGDDAGQFCVELAVSNAEQVSGTIKGLKVGPKETISLDLLTGDSCHKYG